MEDRHAMEKRGFRITALPGWIFLRFSPAISVLLYSDNILTVLETLEFSILIYQLSAYSGPEKKAVYFGNVIFPKIKIVLLVLSRLGHLLCA
jgi:hypothetical protein